MGDLRSISPFENTTVDVIGLVEDFIRRFLILPELAYLPLAVWIVATHLAEVFDVFPYLALNSAVKRCGKTRVLEIQNLLCPRPWFGTSPSCAALFRMMENSPTLLLDEIEALRAKQASDVSQAILAVLNAGHRKGATIPRCDGPKNEVKHFPVFGPKAFACIGDLPGTLADRSIIVRMQRRTRSQKVERFLIRRAQVDADPIVQELQTWAIDHNEAISIAYEHQDDLPFLNDRDADIWMPLFAVCAIASPDRLKMLKECALFLSGSKANDDLEDSLPLRLLADIREVWPDGADHMRTAALIARLAELDESPWAELTPRKLSKILRPFGALSRNLRKGRSVKKGYLFSELSEAFERYVPSGDESIRYNATSPINIGENSDFASATNGKCSR